MPTYQYTCEKCQHTLEAFQKITDGALTKCPACQSDSLKRGIGGGSATFQFKGDGFYITDYKKGSSDPSSSCCPCDKTEGSCNTK
jgi:putative FmdB family regulatory protein